MRGTLALIALVQLVLVLTPATDAIYRWLDVTSPSQPADVLVCLGGNESRLIWTLDAYRRDLAPRVVVSNAPGAATWMQRKLVQCGIPTEHILVDSASAVTGDHAANVARLSGISRAQTRILLVTDAVHSRRALACFRKDGFQQVAVFRSGFQMKWTGGSYQMRCRWRVVTLPHIYYELAGLVQYWWQGRI